MQYDHISYDITGDVWRANPGRSTHFRDDPDGRRLGQAGHPRSGAAVPERVTRSSREPDIRLTKANRLSLTFCTPHNRLAVRAPTPPKACVDFQQPGQSSTPSLSG